MSLPSGYTQVECLEATGTQYIQTDILAVPKVYVELDFQLSVFKTTTLYLFQAYPRTLNSYFDFLINNSKTGTKAIKEDRLGFDISNGGSFKRNTSLSLDSRYIARLNDTDSAYEIYDVTNEMVFKSGTVGSYHLADDVPYYPLRIFAEGVEAKLYGFKVEVNGVLTHDLVPVLDNNETPCVYDTVTGTTYYNSGTGDFLYEPLDIQKKTRLLYTYQNGTKVFRFLTDSNGQQRLLGGA